MRELEEAGPSAPLRQRMRGREANLERIARELSLGPQGLEATSMALPSWVRRQLADLAGLLQNERLLSGGMARTVDP
jgi:hypothetical protein